MKILTLLFIVLFTLSAAAAPRLSIKATIAGLDDKDVLSVPAITVESGHEAVIEVNGIKWSVTPKMLQNGKVALCCVVTQTDGKERHALSAPQVTTDLGKPADFQIRRTKFAIACTLLD
jgi:hypothetical protein